VILRRRRNRSGDGGTGGAHGGSNGGGIGGHSFEAQRDNPQQIGQ